ncbi:alpha/beta hydrolase [Dyadobacter sp. LJ53]|uniref:alpha/beta fold hydrolase n=1 Tax=Dyadobacter chenwenxiniae TaxID=2906456 RepID=UPI001F3427AF|nr:alpha/beta hydrolase [Dyadobacter chenwenxiniae]MCF0049065.1 alpha/beta hydrolase [Dyadobacter chenwenxiniae]
MKTIYALLLLLSLACSLTIGKPIIPVSANNVIDTLIDVGGHRLHFNVRAGTYPAIVFENGGGDNLTVWDGILDSLYKSTGATLITYDRAGFGTSELDSNQISLTQQVISLENGLRALIIEKSYFLVAHSLGGYFSTIFAKRNYKAVKGAVLIDANHVDFWTDKQTKQYWAQYEPLKQKFKTEMVGVYWLMKNAQQNAIEMRKISFPSSVPLIEMLAETPPWQSEDELTRWRLAHKRFVAQAPNRKLIHIKGSGHYIMKDKPNQVIQIISKMYKED